MMALLFILYLVSLGAFIYSRKKLALLIAIVNVLFCLAMLMHHATDILNIRL